MQIYLDKVYDLLTVNCKRRSFSYTKAKGAVSKNLTSIQINNMKDLDKILKLINKNRTTKETRMNHRSSRSHAIFRIKINNPEFR